MNIYLSFRKIKKGLFDKHFCFNLTQEPVCGQFPKFKKHKKFSAFPKQKEADCKSVPAIVLQLEQMK